MTMNVNTCRIMPDGPLRLTGRIRIELPGGAVHEAEEAYLCRCGASQDKPFCDDSHHQAGFADEGVVQSGRLSPAEGGAGTADERPSAGDEPVAIVCAPNGPLLVRGPLVVVGEDGATTQGRKSALCRCGESSSKPFCDGAHRECGFRAE